MNTTAFWLIAILCGIWLIQRGWKKTHPPIPATGGELVGRLVVGLVIGATLAIFGLPILFVLLK